MDDHSIYALNSLLSRHYAIGRILRFRQVRRGCQATCFEVLTAGGREYLLQLFGPRCAVLSLSAAMASLESLRGSGFPVPLLQRPTAPQGVILVEALQGSHMVLAQAVAGQSLPAEEWSLHDLSHLGLRLAWLHRLMRAGLDDSLATGDDLVRNVQAAIDGLKVKRDDFTIPTPAHVTRLLLSLSEVTQTSQGLSHGGISSAAILLDTDRQISAIVDWGLCRPGLPEEDIVDAFVDWCVKPDGMVLRNEAQSLLEAYGSLREHSARPWRDVVLCWCARHLIDHYTGCRPLPRGFATILENPDFLSAAIGLCQSK